MTALLRALAALTLALGLALSPPSGARAADKPTMFVNLTSDDVWTAQMALNFARTLQNDGAPVVVFLNVRAVSLANAKVPQHVEAGTGKTAHQMIADIIAAGGKVFLCGGCTAQAGLSLDDRIAGVEPSGAEMRAIMMQPDTKIISY